jgi:hypothetical protein
LLRRRDEQCSEYSDPDHWPAYCFAEKLKGRMGGDSAAAYRYLAAHVEKPDQFLAEMQTWIDAARRNREQTMEGLRFDVWVAEAFEESKVSAGKVPEISDVELSSRITEAADAFITSVISFLDRHSH